MPFEFSISRNFLPKSGVNEKEEGEISLGLDGEESLFSLVEVSSGTC
jgi:hypothetical protein